MQAVNAERRDLFGSPLKEGFYESGDGAAKDGTEMDTKVT